MLSLPLAFRTTLATVPANVPYLAPSAEKRAAWQARLGARTKPRIGFAWSGNPTQKNDRNRSIPLARLMAVAGNPRFEFHVMQKDIRAADEEALAKSLRPADGLEPAIKAGVFLISCHGTADTVVPFVDNAKPIDRKSTRLNSSHVKRSRMPSSA